MVPFDLKAALDKVPPPHGGVHAPTGAKRQYSDDLSREFSLALTESLCTHFPGTTAGFGGGVDVPTATGFKSVDVVFTIRGAGLGLGISVKTVGLPETGQGYTHNLKRFSEEWTLETILLHRYQPFSIVVGVFFVPVEALWDRVQVTSLSRVLRHFHPFAVREHVNADAELMEGAYIGVYIPDGPNKGFVRFLSVDVEIGPRELPDPALFLTLEAFKDELRERFLTRNRRLRLEGMP